MEISTRQSLRISYQAASVALDIAHRSRLLTTLPSIGMTAVENLELRLCTRDTFFSMACGCIGTMSAQYT